MNLLLQFMTSFRPFGSEIYTLGVSLMLYATEIRRAIAISSTHVQGRYIPLIATRILDKNRALDGEGRDTLPLKSVIIGN